MFKRIVSFFLIISFALLTSCATVSHVPLSKKDKQSIKTVYVNPRIKKPEKMYQFASGSQVGVLFGAVGGLVSGIVNVNAAAKTQLFAERNRIDISKIVYEKWQNKLTDRMKFKTDSQPTDAVLVTDIVLYGVSIPHGFSNDYVPILIMNAKLIRNNKILWQDSGSVLALTGNMPRYKMDQILRDPKKLYVMWDKASERIINAMLRKMDK